jgi:hypothetical protein
MNHERWRGLAIVEACHLHGPHNECVWFQSIHAWRAAAIVAAVVGEIFTTLCHGFIGVSLLCAAVAAGTISYFKERDKASARDPVEVAP